MGRKRGVLYRGRRTILDALVDKAIEAIDELDVSKALERAAAFLPPEPHKGPAKGRKWQKEAKDAEFEELPATTETKP